MLHTGLRVIISITAIATLVSAVVTSPSVPNELVEKNADLGISNDQANLLQDYLYGNVSQVRNLTAIVENLNEEIVNLELTIKTKTEENEKLKGQALALSDAIADITAQLRLLEKSEQIYLIADNLRHPVKMSENGSLIEG